MAMWGMVAVAAASAAANIYANSLRGGAKPGATSVGGKKPFEMPDIFKSKEGAMMGGSGAPRADLSQDLLQRGPAPQAQAQPHYGPTPGAKGDLRAFGPPGAIGAFDEIKRRNMMRSLMGRGF